MPRPIQTIRSTVSPGVSISIWEGEKGFNFTIEKRYQNKAGEWVDGKTFYPRDLAAISSCCQQAIAFADASKEARPEGRTERAVAKAIDKAERAPAAAASFDDDDIPF